VNTPQRNVDGRTARAIHAQSAVNAAFSRIGANLFLLRLLAAAVFKQRGNHRLAGLLQ